MDFHNYADRILHNDKAKEGAKRFAKKNKHVSETRKVTCTWILSKSEFGQLNDKRYLSCDGISSLPFWYQDLQAITEFKDSLNLAPPQDLIKYHKNNLLRFEQEIIQ